MRPYSRARLRHAICLKKGRLTTFATALVEPSREADCAHLYVVAAFPNRRVDGCMRRSITLKCTKDELSASGICASRRATNGPYPSAAGSEPGHPADAHTVT